MKCKGVLVRLALLVMVLLLTCSFATAEEAALEILSCEQQGSAVVLEFLCLDEANTPVELPLNQTAWTVRSDHSLTDLHVQDVSRYQGGTHYIFLYELSVNVYEGSALNKCYAAMKACAEELKPQDSMSIVQVSSKVEVKLNRSGDAETMKNTIARLPRESAAKEPKLYDGINQALSMVNRQPGERTVLIIMSTGTDSGSELTKYQLAQRLEEEDVSAYAVLVNHRSSNKLDANGLEPLCVRGGFLLHAEGMKQAELVECLSKQLLPATREVYTLTATADDASYNHLDQAKLRVFVYKGDVKISGEAFLTTNGALYTAPVVTATAVPAVQETATAAPAATPEVTATPTAEPVRTEPAPEPEITAEPAVIATDAQTEVDLMQYAPLAGGVLAAVIVVILLVVLLSKKARRKKQQKKEENRPAAALKPTQFAPQMPGTQPVKPAAPAQSAPEKPAAPVQPAQTEPVKPAAPIQSAPAEPSKPVTATAPVAEVTHVPAPQNANLDKTMNERQARQPAMDMDKTMDERQARQPAMDMDKTMDERQARRQPVVDMDRTMDERQARKQPAAMQPVSQAERAAMSQDAPVEQERLAEMLAPVSPADQTVVPVNRDPQLILTITDAHGTREASAPLVTGGEITLGRENTDILLDPDDHSISRNHLSIRLTASKLEVQDHSGNGTCVDGRLLRRSEAKLTIGSVMELGGLDEAMKNRVKTVITVKGFHYPGGYR